MNNGWDAEAETIIARFMAGYRAALEDPSVEAPEPVVASRLREKFKYDRNEYFEWVDSIVDPVPADSLPDGAGEVRFAEDAYTHPQPHACFIQSVGDDLVNDGGIMNLWVREARLFKYGSGTGTNFSRLRGYGEPLSGGGRSSGLMSFLKVGDRAADS